MKRHILLSLMAILLAGCSNSDDHLKPGTEMMLSEAGANHLTVENMANGHSPSHVSKGTKVRVVREFGNDSTHRHIDIYILEGANKDENATVDPDHLLPIERTP